MNNIPGAIISSSSLLTRTSKFYDPYDEVTTQILFDTKKTEKRNWVMYMYEMWNCKKLTSVKLAVCSFYAFKRYLLSTDILIKRKWLSENNSFTHHFISFVLMFNRLTSPTDIDSSNCENYSQKDEVIVYNKPFTNGQGCLAPLFKQLQISLETKADIWYIYTTS